MSQASQTRPPPGPQLWQHGVSASASAEAFVWFLGCVTRRRSRQQRRRRQLWESKSQLHDFLLVFRVTVPTRRVEASLLFQCTYSHCSRPFRLSCGPAIGFSCCASQAEHGANQLSSNMKSCDRLLLQYYAATPVWCSMENTNASSEFAVLGQSCHAQVFCRCACTFVNVASYVMFEDVGWPWIRLHLGCCSV